MLHISISRKLRRQSETDHFWIILKRPTEIDCPTWKSRNKLSFMKLTIGLFFGDKNTLACKIKSSTFHSKACTLDFLSFSLLLPLASERLKLHLLHEKKTTKIRCSLLPPPPFFFWPCVSLVLERCTLFPGGGRFLHFYWIFKPSHAEHSSYVSTVVYSSRFTKASHKRLSLLLLSLLRLYILFLWSSQALFLLFTRSRYWIHSVVYVHACFVYSCFSTAFGTRVRPSHALVLFFFCL